MERISPPEEERVREHYKKLTEFGFSMFEYDGEKEEFIPVPGEERFIEMYTEGKPMAMQRERSDGTQVFYWGLKIGFSEGWEV